MMIQAKKGLAGYKRQRWPICCCCCRVVVEAVAMLLAQREGEDDRLRAKKSFLLPLLPIFTQI